METHFENMENAQGALARERVVADLKTLVKDSEELLKATVGDVNEKTKETRARLSAAIERAKATCEDVRERTTAVALGAAKRGDTVIRSHPYESIGVAFGVGLLIGVLVTRK